MDRDKSPDRRASQASLLQLEPEPIDTPSPDVEKRQLSSLEEEETLGDGSVSTLKGSGFSTGTLGLSGSSNVAAQGPGAIFYLMRIQKFSSYAMGFFTSLHLLNVSLIPAATRSVAGSETYLLMTREIYQTSLTEPILVALPVVAHVGSGVLLRLLRRSQRARRYGASPGLSNILTSWPPLSYVSLSGYAFAAFFAAHVYVNRALPLAVEGDSSNIGLGYVAHGFARHPLIAAAAYIGLLVAGCGHMIWGQARWLGLAPSTTSLRREGTNMTAMDKRARRQRRRRWLSIHGASAALAMLWAVGGLGVVARGGLTDGWVGKVYDDMFASIGL